MPVTSHQIEGADPRFLLRCPDSVGVQVTQQKIQTGEIGDAGARGIHVGQDESPDGGGIWSVRMMQQVVTQAGIATVDASDGDVDAIGGGAAHHAGYDHPSATAISEGVREPVTRCVKSIISSRSCSKSYRVGTMDGFFSSGALFLNFRTRSAARSTCSAKEASRSASVSLPCSRPSSVPSLRTCSSESPWRRSSFPRTRSSSRRRPPT